MMPARAQTQEPWQGPVTGLAVTAGDNADTGPTNIDATVDDDDPINYFEFSLSADREVKLRIRSLDFNADLYVEDNSGNILHSSENPRDNKEALNIELAATGTGEVYYIRVEGKGAGENNYTLRYLTGEAATPEAATRTETETDYDAERDDAVSLGDNTAAEATSIDGAVDDDDGIDYFKFNITEQRQVIVTISNLDFDADLHLEGNSGTIISSSENTGTTDELLSVTLEANGTDRVYYVRIEAEEAGHNDYTFTYVTADPPSALVVTEPPLITQDATLSNATDLGTLNNGTTENTGRSLGLGSARSDHLKFTLDAQKEVQITTTHTTGKGVYPLLEIVNAAGYRQFKRDTGGHGGNRISWQVLGPATHYIRYAQDKKQDYVDYDLEVKVRNTPLPNDDYEGDITTAGVLEVDTLLSGVHNDGRSNGETALGTTISRVRHDYDWFAITFDAPRQLHVIELYHSTHANYGDGNSYRTTILPRNANGQFITSGPYNQVLFAAKTLRYTPGPGKKFLDIRGPDGTYDLRAIRASNYREAADVTEGSERNCEDFPRDDSTTTEGVVVPNGGKVTGFLKDQVDSDEDNFKS